MRAVIGPRRCKTARGQVAEERTRMPDFHRARTRHQVGVVGLLYVLPVRGSQFLNQLGDFLSCLISARRGFGDAGSGRRRRKAHVAGVQLGMRKHVRDVGIGRVRALRHATLTPEPAASARAGLALRRALLGAAASGRGVDRWVLCARAERRGGRIRSARSAHRRRIVLRHCLCRTGQLARVHRRRALWSSEE